MVRIVLLHSNLGDQACGVCLVLPRLPSASHTAWHVLAAICTFEGTRCLVFPAKARPPTLFAEWRLRSGCRAWGRSEIPMHSPLTLLPLPISSLLPRYEGDDIYTFAGPVLIALNPCKALPLYTPEVATQYRGGPLWGLHLTMHLNK